MAADLKLINTYQSRRELQSMSPVNRRSFFEHLLDKQRPDICFVPHVEGTRLTKMADGEYEGYSPTSDMNTMLLYNANKVNIRRVNVDYSTSNGFGTLDVERIVCSRVDVHSLPPAKTIVKEFNFITWEKGFFRKDQRNGTTDSRGRNDDDEEDFEEDASLFERFIGFCQFVALKTGVPVIIGGENSMFLRDILKILKKARTEMRNSFLKRTHEYLEEEHKFLPSMTKGSTRPQRDLFEMRAVYCQGTSEDACRMSDFVIASKQLQMTDPTPIDMPSTFGSAISNLFFNGVCPLAMGLQYAIRKTKYSGG